MSKVPRVPIVPNTPKLPNSEVPKVPKTWWTDHRIILITGFFNFSLGQKVLPDSYKMKFKSFWFFKHYEKNEGKFKYFSNLLNSPASIFFEELSWGWSILPSHAVRVHSLALLALVGRLWEDYLDSFWHELMEILLCQEQTNIDEKNEFFQSKMEIWRGQICLKSLKMNPENGSESIKRD